MRGWQRTLAVAKIGTEDLLAAEGHSDSEGRFSVGQKDDGSARLAGRQLDLLDGGERAQERCDVCSCDGGRQGTDANNTAGFVRDGRGLDRAAVVVLLLLWRGDGAGLRAVGESHGHAPEQAVKSIDDVVFGVDGQLGRGIVDDGVGLNGIARTRGSGLLGCGKQKEQRDQPLTRSGTNRTDSTGP